MTKEEISSLYIRITFQYEFALNQLIDKGLIWQTSTKRLFTTHWMKKNCGRLKRLRAILKSYVAICEVCYGYTHDQTVTPSLWIRRTHAVGLYVKQGLQKDWH